MDGWKDWRSLASDISLIIQIGMACYSVYLYRKAIINWLCGVWSVFSAERRRLTWAEKRLVNRIEDLDTLKAHPEKGSIYVGQQLFTVIMELFIALLFLLFMFQYSVPITKDIDTYLIFIKNIFKVIVLVGFVALVFDIIRVVATTLDNLNYVWGKTAYIDIKKDLETQLGTVRQKLQKYINK